MIRARGNGEDAQGLIEFALIAMVLLLFFGGTVDLSRFMYYSSAIHNAARIGAETASNRCPDHSNCQLGTTPTAALIFQNVECEGSPFVSLTPTVSTCDQTCLVGSAACASPCPIASCPACGTAQDVCISGTLSPGNTIQVSVGYSFKPFTPLINQFFQETSCFTGDSPSVNHHTLCAIAAGRATS